MFLRNNYVAISKSMFPDNLLTPTSLRKRVRVSISISVCKKFEEIDKKIDSPDSVMYRAKRKGKNRFE